MKRFFGIKEQPIDYSHQMIYTAERRKKESDKIKLKYPDKIPIIIEKYGASNIEDIDRHKVLLPKNAKVSQLIYHISKNIKKDETQTIFVYVNASVNPILPHSNATINDIYCKYKDPDGFLYITYAGENTFG